MNTVHTVGQPRGYRHRDKVIGIALLLILTASAGAAFAEPFPPSDQTPSGVAPLLASPVTPTTTTNPDGDWAQVGAPFKRTGQAGVYDPTRKYLWIFGGGGTFGGTGGDQLCAFDLSGPSTVLLDVAVAGTRPSPRSGAKMIFDPVRNRAIMFGGVGSEVWELSLTGTPAWTQLSPQGTAPSTRVEMVVVYDSFRDRMLVCGGHDTAANVDLNDVWSLSFSPTLAWTQLPTNGPLPPVRWGHAGAYDADNDRLLIAAGRQGYYTTTFTVLNDTRALSLSTLTWSLLTTGGGVVDAGGNAIFDPIRHRLIFDGGGFPCGGFGGKQLDLTNPTAAWTAFGSGYNPFDHLTVYDPDQDRIIVHGGQTWCGQSTYTTYADLLAMPLSGAPSWTNIAPPAVPKPPGRIFPNIVYAGSRRQAIVVGGLGRNDAWSLDLTGSWAWTNLVPAGTPIQDFNGASAVYDAPSDRIIFFGGGGSHGSSTLSCLKLSPTPMWDTLTVLGTPPPPRRFHSAIIDPIGNRMIIYGGTNAIGFPEPGDPNPVLFDTWQLTLTQPMSWSEVTFSGFPPSRYRHGAMLDPIRHRMIVCGGVNAQAYALTLGKFPAWSEITTTNNPPSPATTIAPTVYDPIADRMLFINTNLQTFELSFAQGGAAWRQLAPTAQPASRKPRSGTMFDPYDNRLLLYAGEDYGGCPSCPTGPELDDLWVLSFPPPATGVEPGVDQGRTLTLRAFPNPSSDETTFEFRLPTARDAQLRIYDLSGRMVREVRTGVAPAGVNRVSWDGRDVEGNRVTPGLYFARARLGGDELRRTIVRVR
jgi:FlgD Ig-like domain